VLHKQAEERDTTYASGPKANRKRTDSGFRTLNSLQSFDPDSDKNFAAQSHKNYAGSEGGSVSVFGRRRGGVVEEEQSQIEGLMLTGESQFSSPVVACLFQEPALGAPRAAGAGVDEGAREASRQVQFSNLASGLTDHAPLDYIKDYAWEEEAEGGCKELDIATSLAVVQAEDEIRFYPVLSLLTTLSARKNSALSELGQMLSRIDEQPSLGEDEGEADYVVAAGKPVLCKGLFAGSTVGAAATTTTTAKRKATTATPAPTSAPAPAPAMTALETSFSGAPEPNRPPPAPSPQPTRSATTATTPTATTAGAADSRVLGRGAGVGKKSMMDASVCVGTAGRATAPPPTTTTTTYTTAAEDSRRGKSNGSNSSSSNSNVHVDVQKKTTGGAGQATTTTTTTTTSTSALKQNVNYTAVEAAVEAVRKGAGAGVVSHTKSRALPPAPPPPPPAQNSLATTRRRNAAAATTARTTATATGSAAVSGVSAHRKVW
jgi:hypothetical protein